MLDNQVCKSLAIFWMKKDAVQFCKSTEFTQAEITKVESRFQHGYAIGTGRGYYLLDE